MGVVESKGKHSGTPKGATVEVREKELSSMVKVD